MPVFLGHIIQMSSKSKFASRCFVRFIPGWLNSSTQTFDSLGESWGIKPYKQDYLQLLGGSTILSILRAVHPYHLPNNIGQEYVHRWKKTWTSCHAMESIMSDWTPPLRPGHNNSCFCTSVCKTCFLRRADPQSSGVYPQVANVMFVQIISFDETTVLTRTLYVRDQWLLKGVFSVRWGEVGSKMNMLCNIIIYKNYL